ncbi:MAG: tRNA pseudouridine(55) synthase TruB [Gammaproteobacteria bacterium GWE2_37_16]|nr:MAG: tRNA pseudouridine(55) synthase TruB [Gammaproteobacteria bacterium GWE2_37_16]
MQKNKYNQVNIDGVLLLDKPINITSNDALQRVKRLYKARKAGHTGSLDPLASGMLPICFGEATKFAQFLLDTDKKYQVTAQLGIKTTTGDAEGEILIQKNVPNFKEPQIEEVLARFRGPIEQIPSMYSALKHNGQPLYKLARAGISVIREKRPVTIYSLELINKTDTQLEMTVHCSKGTYVRTLVEDIGEALGCEAHVIALRRLTVGKYQENQMVTLATIEKLTEEENYNGLKELLLPMESMVAHWPLVQVTEAIAYFMHQGNPVIIPQAPTQGWLRLQSKSGHFLGVGEVLPDGKVAPRRLIK